MRSRFLGIRRDNQGRCIDRFFWLVLRILRNVGRSGYPEDDSNQKRVRLRCFERHGAYNTCAHGCVYCYANCNPELAARNRALVRADQPCLDPKAVEFRVRADNGNKNKTTAAKVAITRQSDSYSLANRIEPVD